ncbi:ABC transporter permease [Microbacterium sp. NIBRBAC000506063]|uniref:ABC transporter permease n=1 Tax=Microbacterium sp. NIBRBAC000506063 TaxID=2734618 RepID=UPI002948C488|nr:ABC transporter permease [Microbacterium sp. NIBRBAC000506063]
MYVANDMRTGIIDRFRTMPLRAGAVLTGHVVASLLRNLIATAVVIGVGVLVGFRPTATFWEWVAAGALIALYILAITYLFAAIGLAAGSPRPPTATGSSCCSCRTCPAPSPRCRPCRPGSSRSPATSRSRRSSRRSAGCSWARR